MKFETLKKSHKKEIIIGVVVLLLIVSVVVFKTTRAKYRTTQSINILNGTITYKPYDLKVLAMYKQKEGSSCTEDNCYEEITGRMPTNGYTINESKSYCTLDGTNKDTEVRLYTNSSMEHVMANLAKNEKCKLYFDVKRIPLSDIIASLSPKTSTPSYSSAATGDEGVYKISDGMYGNYSYVWRGAVKNNWVKFANMYWRIIRINGDGTMRLIYTGNSSLSNVTVDANGITATGEGTQIGTSAYNISNNRSEYVGYRYTTGSQRPSSTTSGTSSTIKGIVDNWYNTNIGNNTTYSSKVADGKYCNDRNMASGSWSSQPSNHLYYAAYGRLQTNKTPTLSCSNSGDIYTLKAGLITADEVSMAGGLNGTNNSNYYLYTNKSYWMMTPCMWFFDYVDMGRASVYSVSSLGGFGSDMNSALGVRPVINLKANIQFASTGTGTRTNPYVVS